VEYLAEEVDFKISNILKEKDTPNKTYTEIFEELCPLFLSMGMTYQEYWDGNNELPSLYLKKFKIEQERANEQAWLMGLYIYDTICNLAPIFRPFSKKVNIKPYRKEPFSTKAKDGVEIEITDEKKIEQERLKAYVHFKEWAKMVKKNHSRD